MALSGQLSGFAIVADSASGLLGDGRTPDYKQLYFQLKRDLSSIWNLETEEEMRRLANAHSPATKTVAEAKAETLFQESLVFTEQNTYEVGLLWQSDLRPPNNYKRALEMFYKLEADLARHPEKCAAFHQAHQDWLMDGYLQRVEGSSMDGDQFFLPGFVVERETSHGKTYRYVMDGARKFQGHCLNDYLLPGPNVMNNLAEVLLRFRRHPHVITCDIKGMFLGIFVKETDQKYLRVLYRESPNLPVSVYQCTRHVFGLCCSPYVAMSTVMHHAVKNAHKWPMALKLLRENTIVDDILASFSARSDLAEARRQLTDLFHSMNLKPHKWASNDVKVLEDLPEMDKAKTVEVSLDEGAALQIRTLGILWLSDTDEFQYVYEPPPPHRWTLRTLASLLGKLVRPYVLNKP